MVRGEDVDVVEIFPQCVDIILRRKLGSHIAQWTKPLEIVDGQK